MTKKFLLIFQNTPYSSYSTEEVLEMMVALNALDQTISLLFLGSSVYQLLKNQTPSLLNRNDFLSVLGGLHYYEIKNVFVEAHQLSISGIKEDDLIAPIAILNPKDIAKCIKNHDIVLSL